MKTATLINALNTNFNIVQSQDRTKIVTDENGVNRILIGRAPNGNYVVAISVEGVDVVTALGK